MRYLTDELPGTGGRTKVRPEDFRVTELPLYEPAGAGEHTYLFIEKVGLGTLEAADRIAHALGRPRRAVGLAGLKDSRAVTRQWISIQGVDPRRAERLHAPGVKILNVSRHRNKLKIGHLAGNRFEIRVRDCDAGALRKAQAVLEVLSRRGPPNAFDAQRFGRRGDNHHLGRALVLGEHQAFCDRFLGGPADADSPRLREARRRYDAGNLPGARKRFAGQRDHLRVLRALERARDPARATRALPKQLARLFISAYQSHLFNQVLERRLDGLDRVEAGDLAYIHPQRGRGGAVFLVERPDHEQPRADRFEISPSGPLVGHRVSLAAGRPGDIERDVLAANHVAPAHFERVRALRLRGGRRPLRAPLTEVSVRPIEGGDLLLAFTLPPGAYATIVVAEVTKSES